MLTAGAGDQALQRKAAAPFLIAGLPVPPGPGAAPGAILGRWGWAAPATPRGQALMEPAEQRDPFSSSPTAAGTA